MLKFPFLKSKRGNEDRTNEPEIGGCSRGTAVRIVAIFQIRGCPHAQWRTVKYSRRFSRRECAVTFYAGEFEHCMRFFGLLALFSNDITLKNYDLPKRSTPQ